MAHDCNEDQTEQALLHHVKTTGWFVMKVLASDYLPGFAYTIGLWKNYNHPEIISFGLTLDMLHAIINDAGEMVKDKKALNTYVPYSDFLEKSDVQFIPVDPRSIRDYFGWAVWFNQGADFPAMQMVWNDRNNKFPWDPEYQEEFKFRQPLLDRNADFKFREPENLCAFTTRQWMEGKPIVYVVHDEDGDWQFLTGDQMPEDIKLVCLKDLVEKDKSLNDVFNLDYGEYAERDTVNGKWIRGECEPEE
ncbi:MAG: DUF4262 domain-containing protein [Bacteroidota bacterium]